MTTRQKDWRLICETETIGVAGGVAADFHRLFKSKQKYAAPSFGILFGLLHWEYQQQACLRLAEFNMEEQKSELGGHNDS